ncbi:MAG: class I SAM-dependent methyltransferase [Burkholderiaceae bacterium]
MNPLSDVVAGQYERWVYPEPIQDLPAWLASNWQWFDPSHAHRLFWPDRDYRPNLDILIAGCGTNQAAVFAYTNPAARVVAIDVSAASLKHHHFLKEKYGLKNLELHRLPIEEVGSLGHDYDLMVSTGVLHHMADPDAGMRALAGCLRPEGVAAIMLYARYGRIGVEMLQGVFRDLQLAQDEPSLSVVKAGISALAQDHPLRSYLAVAPDLQFDAGLVDTFLHGRDRSYTVADCLDLVNGAGLVFQDWFLKSSYEPVVVASDPFLTAIAALPEQERWAAMERINHRNACHFFTACRPERASETYRVDITSNRWLDAVPMFRYRCGLVGETIKRPGWSVTLSPEQFAIMRHVDGQRSTREILAMDTSASADASTRLERERFAESLFKMLVNRDFLTLALPARG